MDLYLLRIPFLAYHKAKTCMKYAFLAFGVLLQSMAVAQVQFTNVSSLVGLDYQGRTYGSSWADVDNDGLLDLFMSCHQHKTEPFYRNDTIRLYKNLGQTFDMEAFPISDGNQSDFHGGMFYDADNDGDPDLLMMTGGTKQEVFLRNDPTGFSTDQATSMNLGMGKSRGRQATPLDVNGDGLIDLIMNNEVQNSPQGYGSRLMLAHAGAPYEMLPAADFDEPASIISVAIDLNGDHMTDLVTVTDERVDIFSGSANGTLTLVEQLAYGSVTDLSIADFNGDGRPDIFLARGLLEGTDIQQFDAKTIFASNRVSPGSPECSAVFTTEGRLKVSLLNADGNPYTMKVGSALAWAGMTNSPVKQFRTFMVDQAAPWAAGFQVPDLQTPGVHCSFGRTAAQTWKYAVRNNGPTGSVVIMKIRSNKPITAFQAAGMLVPGEESRDVLLLNEGGFNFNEDTGPVFDLMEFSVACTAADFDNDMDQDLIVMATGRAKNRECHLYENLGGGTFSVHPNGWGIKGDVAGVGDAVTTADYDNDGFMDLFVTNGSTDFFLDSAGVDLYRNLGNANHWLTVDLDGTASNADGIGAEVTVVAGGMRQVAHMTAGVHTASQNDPRLHFGLGNNASVDTLLVQWPSGIVDCIAGPSVGQILHVVEGSYTLPPQVPLITSLTQIQALAQLGQITQVLIHDPLGRLVAMRNARDMPVEPRDMGLGQGLFLITCLNADGVAVATTKVVLP